ncbi:DegV family protein [Thermoactinomyces sp. CICC 10735]|uniref:DegV family protein n=1 Tax=Thermoactinomyces sp. CICC 10735 TaxID=2767430 RepID=UPI0018DB8302|nr:DegV family protein [Thermoactinomyces sp. CICC 10735]MBH8584039.1 DegV family protein [Thermoactinomyces sp. CICC 10735]
MKIALVTDSTCDLPCEMVEKLNIHVVPLRIHYSGGEFRDGIDITSRDIINRLEHEVPKTSMPSPEDITRIYHSLQEQGYTHCIVLTVSASLSGTHNTFRLCAQEISGMKIDVIDSKGVSWILGFLVLETARLIQKTKNYEEIIRKIHETKEKIKAYFILDTLQYVQKGGRIGKVAKSLGSMLSIKPVITFDSEGKLHTHSVARGKKQALKKLMVPVYEHLSSTRARIAVLHTQAEKEAEALLNQVKNAGNVSETYLGWISPTLAVHAGPGLLGIVIHPQD